MKRGAKKESEDALFVIQNFCNFIKQLLFKYNTSRRIVMQLLLVCNCAISAKKTSKLYFFVTKLCFMKKVQIEVYKRRRIWRLSFVIICFQVYRLITTVKNSILLNLYWKKLIAGRTTDKVINFYFGNVKNLKLTLFS